MSDAYGLQRFIDAQVYSFEQARQELRRGKKVGHWMWYIFPQIAGLGFSSTSRLYAIKSLNEAKAYLMHPILGARLRECTELMNRVQGRTITEILGGDDVKFRSSMTLFAQAGIEQEVFEAALGKYFNGQKDQQTIALLNAMSSI